MTGLPVWLAVWELATVVAVLVGYGWLAALSDRQRALSRRLGRHLARELGGPRRPAARAEVTVPLPAQSDRHGEGR